MDRGYNSIVLLTAVVCCLLCRPLSIPVRGGSVVGTAQTVQGWKGEDIRLPCDIQREPSIVYWVKVNITDTRQQTEKATFFEGEIESREERFNIDTNFGLVISELEVADEGRYLCQVALGKEASVRNSTQLTVSSVASKHAIEECTEKTQSYQSQCTYQAPSNTSSFNLTCVVSGFKPNISMHWTDESGKRLSSGISQQTTLSDGTYERFEIITLSVEDGTERAFMCNATGDSLNGTSSIEITILPIAGKLDSSLIAGLVVGLLLGMVVILLVIFRKRVQKYTASCLRRKEDQHRQEFEEESEFEVEIGLTPKPRHLEETSERDKLLEVNVHEASASAKKG